MGVKGLWKILEPSGRRISLDSLNGLVLAVGTAIVLYVAMLVIHSYRCIHYRCEHMVESSYQKRRGQLDNFQHTFTVAVSQNMQATLLSY